MRDVTLHVIVTCLKLDQDIDGQIPVSFLTSHDHASVTVRHGSITLLSKERYFYCKLS